MGFRWTNYTQSKIHTLWLDDMEHASSSMVGTVFPTHDEQEPPGWYWNAKKDGLFDIAPTFEEACARLMAVAIVDGVV
jgi:hypothetical protein